MPFGRSRCGLSLANRAHVALKSAVGMPLKQYEKTFCLAFQFGYSPIFINTSSGEKRRKHSANSFVPFAKRMNSSSESRYVSVPSKSKA